MSHKIHKDGNILYVSNSGNDLIARRGDPENSYGTIMESIIESTPNDYICFIDGTPSEEINFVADNLGLNFKEGLNLNGYIWCQGSNIDIYGKPFLTSFGDPVFGGIFYWMDSEGSLELSKVFSNRPVVFDCPQNRTFFLECSSINLILEDGDIPSVGGLQNGGISFDSGCQLYANIDNIKVFQSISDPQTSGFPSCVLTVGQYSNVHLSFKVLEGNIDVGTTFSKACVSAILLSKLYLSGNVIHNTGGGKAIRVETDASIYLHVSEIRVTSETIEAISMVSGNLYFDSGCRVISGSSSTYAIVGTGDLYISGEVYSNKPLDPGITLKTGNWVVSPDIV